MSPRRLKTPQYGSKTMSRRFQDSSRRLWTLPRLCDPWDPWTLGPSFRPSVRPCVRPSDRSSKGEVALAWNIWRWSPHPLPRDKVLWNPQYSTNNMSAYALASMLNGSDFEIDDNVDLLAVGNTTILRSSRAVLSLWVSCWLNSVTGSPSAT